MAQTQEEFFASLGQASAPVDPDAPKIPYAGFKEKGVGVTGTVDGVPFITTERAYKNNPVPTDKNGNLKPEIIYTFSGKEGKFKIAFKGALLFALRQAMTEAGASSLPHGTVVGAAWTSDFETANGAAKQYTVKIKLAE
jgi:hypothetical protein